MSQEKPESLGKEKGLQDYSTRDDCQLGHLD